MFEFKKKVSLDLREVTRNPIVFRMMEASYDRRLVKHMVTPMGYSSSILFNISLTSERSSYVKKPYPRPYDLREVTPYPINS